MAEVVDETSCSEAIANALSRWCAAEDTIFTYEGATPRKGSVYQLAGRDELAHCVCAKGLLDFVSPSHEIVLEGDQNTVVNLNTTFIDPGASCQDPEAALTMSGDANVDTSQSASYPITYTCCPSGAGTCSTRDRVVIVNDNASGDCADWMSGGSLPVTRDSSSMGGCLVDRRVEVSMNNFYKDFPNPAQKFFWANKFFWVGGCAEKPSYNTDRRVCYCT